MEYAHSSSQTLWPGPAEVIRAAFQPKSEPFQYGRRLEGRFIRLIRLQPGSGDDEVDCTLIERCIDDDSSYVALSYVWGQSTDTRTILCNGRPLEVTRNLHSFLVHLRLQSQDLDQDTFWADAVCINQSDLLEKSEQVSMMAEIYDRATHVMGWLGEAQERDEDALKLLHQLIDLDSARLSPETQDQVHDFDIRTANILYNETLTSVDLPPDYPENPIWMALLNLLRNEFFGRIWIIQEYLQAKDCSFMKGSLLFPADPLLDLAENLASNPLWPTTILAMEPEAVAMYDNVRQLKALKALKTSQTSPDITDVLWRTHIFGSTNALDKVYAVAAFTSSFDTKIIDYKQDVNQMLIKVASEASSLNRSDGHSTTIVKMLFHAQAMPQRAGLPSWVPDWTSEEWLCNPIYAHLPFYAMSGIQPVLIDVHGALPIHVKIFDRIRNINIYYDEFDRIPTRAVHLYNAFRTERDMNISRLSELGSHENDIHEAALQMVQSLGSYPTGQKLDRIYWESQIFNYHGSNATALSEYPDIFPAALEGIRACELASMRLEQVCRVTGQCNKYASLFFDAVYLLGTGLWYYRNPPLPRFRWWYLLAWSSVFFLGEVGIDRAASYCSSILLDQFAVYVKDVAEETSSFVHDSFVSINNADSFGRNFCTTEAGYVAWVSRHARIGDDICLLDGSHIPFVIRRVEGQADEDNGYLLKGDCYVHGLMENLHDAFTKGELGVEPWRTFEARLV